MTSSVQHALAAFVAGAVVSFSVFGGDAPSRSLSAERVGSPRALPRRRARRKVAILGGTGLVGRRLAQRLLTHPTMELHLLIGSEDSAGRPLGNVWTKKEEALRTHYGEWWEVEPCPAVLETLVIASFAQLLACAPGDVAVLSCVAPHLGELEDKLVSAGFSVYSISPHARHRAGVPLMVPEVNGMESLTRHASALQQAPGRMFKSPNCVSCGLCLVLDAIDGAFGLLEVSVTTFQSLTGRGDAVYDAALVRGNILPLGRTVEDANRKIRQEVHDILGPNRAHVKVSVTAQRVFSQRGHYVDIRVKTRSPVASEATLASALEAYAPFANTKYASLPDAPARPIRVSLEPMFPRPVQSVALVQQDNGMAVHVGHLCVDDEVFSASLSMVVDNLARGAFGACLLLAEFCERFYDVASSS